MATSPSDEFDDAWDMLNSYLQDWGLESLGAKARGFLLDGDSMDVITLKLRDTDEYKTRFAGNEARRKAGLRVLSPAEYIENERQYRQALREFGMPEGFYDSLDDFKGFIENDMSPQELRDRAAAAQSRYIQATPEEQEQMQRVMGGITPGAVVAGLLDPDRALPELERQFNAASIAAEAQRAFSDRNRLDVGRADELARAGVSQDEARNAFGELAGRQERDTYLAQLSGRDLTARDQEDELLLNDQDAGARRRKAQAEERARFGSNFLATDRGAGLSRDSSGSY